MKNIRGFFKQLHSGKVPKHTIHIIFVGCIALALAAALLGLLMLLPAPDMAKEQGSLSSDETVLKTGNPTQILKKSGTQLHLRPALLS